MTTGWLLRGRDGRLTAYAPTTDGVLRWTEAEPGGPRWAGPELLAAPGLRPHLSVTRSTEGYVHLLGLRTRPRADGPDDTEIVHAVQFQTARPLRDWQSLGNPHSKDRGIAAKVSPPAAAVDAAGSLHVFLRSGVGTLAFRNQSPTGRWDGWRGADPGPNKLTGQPSVTLTDDGAIEVLVPAGDTVAHWRRPKPDAKPDRAGEGTEPAARVAPGTITAERTGPGRLTHFWRDAGDSTVHAWRPGAAPVALGGPGSGPTALLRTAVDGLDCTVLAGCGPDGRLQVAAYPTETEEAGLNWTPTGEPGTGAPALALDARGRVVLAAVGEDGALRVTRQKPEPGLALEAWTLL